ncbi:U-box domain-containing protein 40-like [Tasmannia lanceolata]|uniref:U-box domain-containing protein 40-like n=1 Tax=Tasmannia lanceolata TaxID=3420 RepID=UPI0040640C0C
MGSGKQHRWRISFHRSSPRSQTLKKPPSEFICPISASLMADPVIISSGQTFERNCIRACKDLGFVPRLEEGSHPDLSSLIPNLALKSTIINWCNVSGVEKPKPLEPEAAKELVRTLMAESGIDHEIKIEITETDHGEIRKDEEIGSSDKELLRGVSPSDKELLKGVSENPPVKFSYASTDLNRRHKHFYSSSEESMASTPLPLTTKPSCYSSSSSSSSCEIINETLALTLTLGQDSTQELEILTKLKSSQIYEQEEAVISLRKLSKNNPEQRIPLCTPRLLAFLKPLLISRYSAIQINAVASLVNLSLEKPNKIKIVRSGSVPALIDVLKGGFQEAQEHAAGAIFSLSLEDENKTAIGVLGALPPLLHMLRSESERTRQDSALALYHLSLVQSNRSKLVKLGAIPTLLAMASRDELATRILIILYNLASSAEGRAALLDAHAVEVFVEMLSQRGEKSDCVNSASEHCVAALFALSQSGMRFIGSAKAAGASEVLKEVGERGSERAREKAKRMLVLLKGKRDEGGEEEDEEEKVSDSVVTFRHGLYRGGKNVPGANSTEF